MSTSLAFTCACSAAGCKLRAFGVLHRDEILDAQGVQRLAAKALGDHAGADALAGRIDGSGCAGRSAADDQHVEAFLGAQLPGIARRRTGVQLGDDLGQFHAARAERLAVEEHAGHGHDLALLDFVTEQPAVDRHVAHARVQHRHQVQRLDHVGAVVAGQAHPGLEDEVAFQGLDLFDEFLFDLGRMAAGLQQRQHQRGELVAHRQGREAQAHVGAGLRDLERRATGLVAVETRADQRREAGDLLQQFAHLARLFAAVEGSHQLDRVLHTFEVGLELGLERAVEHGGSSFDVLRFRSCRPGRATGSAWLRRRSTWRDRPGPGSWRCTARR